MANEVLYPADAVLKMLVAAYHAGFDGPLEMDEEACREIMTKMTYTDSDLSLMQHMQERELKRKADRENAEPANRRNAAPYPYGGGGYGGKGQWAPPPKFQPEGNPGEYGDG